MAPVTTPGGTTARGYGSEHQRARAQLAPVVAEGRAWCTEPVCLMRSRWIRPGSDWDLAHLPDRSGYRGPAHARCNRSEGSKRGNRGRGRRRPVIPAVVTGWRTSRQW
jgi:hypothetical protein